MDEKCKGIYTVEDSYVLLIRAPNTIRDMVMSEYLERWSPIESGLFCLVGG